MKKTNKLEEREARKLITRFSHEFYSKFRVYPTVTYDLSIRNLFYLVNLESLIKVTDELLNKDEDICDVPEEKRSIKLKSRKSLIVTYRGCMIHIARRMNYGYSELGRALGLANHTTVLHAHNRTEGLLDVKDVLVSSVYKKIENELKARYGTSRDVQSHSPAGVNS